jgi:hypothetical protein
MKRLFLVPVAALALFFAGRFFLPPSALRLFYRIDVIAVALLAVAGCVAAARVFERGDHLRVAWYLNGASYLFVMLGAVVRIPMPTREILVVRSVLVLGANVLAIASMWLFARTYRVAGLELPGSRARKGLIVTTAVVLAVLAAGHSVYLGIRNVAGGDLEGLMRVLSGTGDIITFILIAPILMTALALRGGLLVWPWSFLVAANVCWLLFDAQDTLTFYVPLIVGQVLEDYSETWRTLACALTFCAALAQRRLSTGEETGG